MNWTRDHPPIPGWYWFNGIAGPGIVVRAYIWPRRRRDGFQAHPAERSPLLVDGSNARIDLLDNRFNLLQDLVHLFQMV